MNLEKFGSAFDRVDNVVFAIEKVIVTVFFSVMTLVVALDVMHRIFVTDDGFFARMWIRAGATEETARALLAPATLALVAVLFVYAALRERWGQDSNRGKAIAYAVAGVAVTAVAIELFIMAFPNGLIWSQTLGLSMMLWIGLIGASMAAKHQRHLSLEFGTKIWPQGMRKYVRIFAGMVVAGFCSFLAYLAWTLIVAEYTDYDPIYRTGVLSGIPLPKFVVYSVLPYGFFMIVFRFFRTSLTSTDVREADLILKGAGQHPDETV